MKIVIKLDKRLYKYAKHHTLTFAEIDEICDVIANGTPLPKGHGRLIDANELEECKEMMNTISGESKYAVRMDDIRSADTIIEADKAESEDKYADYN